MELIVFWRYLFPFIYYKGMCMTNLDLKYFNNY